ncbi:hypothetical protein RUND412_006381, partial [Rhizina undulata]
MPSLFSHLSTRLYNLFATSPISSRPRDITATFNLLNPPYENLKSANRMLSSTLISSGAAPELEQEIEAYISRLEEFLARGADAYFILNSET